MQTARLPWSTCGDNARKVRRFLWGAALERKIHLAPWVLVTQRKELGGLEIPAMRAVQRSLVDEAGMEDAFRG